MPRTRGKVKVQALWVGGGGTQVRDDQLAVEEPLEIRLSSGSNARTLAVTMRTPGHDFELAAGFLVGEGVLSNRQDIIQVSYCLDGVPNDPQMYNVVNVQLRAAELPDLPSLERHFMTSSSCGVCGKASLDSLRVRAQPLPRGSERVSEAVLLRLPQELSSRQRIFHATGGLHAAALFDLDGRLIQVREDVGRHNALDKLVGWALLNDMVPLTRHILLVSGRSSFEILQKALAVRIPVVAAVSAPSSLAVELAKEFEITLIGFLRQASFNVYTAPWRVVASSAQVLDSPVVEVMGG